MLRPILEASGLTAGRDFFLAYSPEREDPGNRDFATRNIPKVVGGIDAASRDLAVALYAPVVDGVVPVSSTRGGRGVQDPGEHLPRREHRPGQRAEGASSTRMGIDIWEVIDAAKTKPFGFQAFYPGPGLGGHCIPIDPFYLTWVGPQVRPAHALHRAGRRDQHGHAAATSSSRVADALNERRQAGQGQPGLRAGHRLQEGRGRPARVAGLRDPGAAAERGARSSPTTIRTSRRCRPCATTRIRLDSQPLTAGVPGRAGLRADRHRPLGLRLRLDRAARPAGRRHAQRHGGLRGDGECRIVKA